MKTFTVNTRIVSSLDLGTMTSPELLALYNEVAVLLKKTSVKRFSDRTTAQKRTLAILEELPQPEVKGHPEQLPPVKKAVVTKADGSARRQRGMRFRFTMQEPATASRRPNTLRARCEELLLREGGATFEQVETLIKEFDQERGKDTVNLRRRTYELIRIMHYHLGHGLDDSTGTIRILAKQGRLQGT